MSQTLNQSPQGHRDDGPRVMEPGKTGLTFRGEPIELIDFRLLDAESFTSLLDMVDEALTEANRQIWAAAAAHKAGHASVHIAQMRILRRQRDARERCLTRMMRYQRRSFDRHRTTTAGRQAAGDSFRQVARQELEPGVYQRLVALAEQRRQAEISRRTGMALGEARPA